MYQQNNRHSETEQRFQGFVAEHHHAKVRADRTPCRSQAQQHPLRDAPPVIDGFQFIQTVDEKSYDVDDTKRVKNHNNIFTLLPSYLFFYNLHYMCQFVSKPYILFNLFARFFLQRLQETERKICSNPVKHSFGVNTFFQQPAFFFPFVQ